ncbi:hypothetical protein BHM03_00048660, partial [Ensete ventricosum]
PAHYLPRFQIVSERVLSGDTAKRPTPTPSASIRSLSDPNTLSSDSIDSLRAQLHLVNQRIDDVHKTIRMKDERGEGSLYSPPFIQEIQDTPILQNFCVPTLEAYDGGSDPAKHVAAFRVQMALYDTSDALMCRVIPTTLRGVAQGWYRRLPPTSIHSFDQLAREFEVNFLASSPPKPITASLLGMRQREDKPLDLYLARFMVILDVHPSLIREKGLQKAPNPMRNPGCDRGHYYRFHHDYEHDTKECHDLKNHIEDLVCQGHLDHFVRRLCELSLRPKGPVEKQIDVIVGRPTMGNDNSSARRACAHAEVQKRPHARSNPEITFESESEYPDHDDALVIMAHIANTRVKCIMIDIGSSADIFYFDALMKLDMTNRDLIPMASALTRFPWDAITPVGIATLPMTFGDESRTKILMDSFTVVELPSIYNVIIE